MRYMLMICSEETDLQSPAEMRQLPEFIAYSEWSEQTGALRGGNRLRPSSDATTVQVRDGEVVLTDGPFAETKDQMGGYDLIECEDLDTAIEIAAKHPIARVGRIEIRPVWEE